MKEKRSEDLILANEKLAFQNELKEKRAVELILANKKLAFENEEKEKRAAELILANEELAFQDKLKEKRAVELIFANKELALECQEKEKREAELILANEELAFQDELKEKRAQELILANKELAFQNEEKKKRAGELLLVKEEINFQDELKEKRAGELILVNEEIDFQDEEKEKRAKELILANKELAFQNKEKEKRAAELILANKELAFYNEEKEKRAQELILANKELAFQNKEKEKRAAELILANNELAFQKEELETIFNYTQDGITVTDLEGNFLKSNKEFLKITGFSKEELLTKNCHLLTAPTDRKRNKQAVQKAIDTNSVVHIEKKYILKDDKIVLVSMSISLLPDKKRLLLLVHDNTTLKLMQEQSKLAAMGEMIGNIAHQWRQPLSIISLGATGMKLQKEYGCLSDEMFYNECDDINKNAQYLSKTIDDFRNFIRGDRIKTLFNLKSEINSFLDLIKGTIKNNNITVILELEDNIELNGYENELTQCFINIVNNAKDAFVELDIKDRLIFIETTKTKSKVIIKIRDNGGGIDCEVLPKIFEPYFTTKHQTQGTGLGLHMSYNLIVDGMKGNIEADNVTYEYNDKKHTGAEFTIELPLS